MHRVAVLTFALATAACAATAAAAQDQPAPDQGSPQQPPTSQTASSPATPPQAGAAAATVNPGWQVAWNFGASTDYVFRGLSQTDGRGQGFAGVDATYNQFYVGAWTSNVHFSGTSGPDEEVDVYGGWRPEFMGYNLDFGAQYYGYIDQPRHANVDYWEFYAKGTRAIGPFTPGLSVYYSPEFSGKTGDAWYYEANAAYALTRKLSVSGAVGRQTIELAKDYTTWNLGATYALMDHLSLDVRYWDTDEHRVYGDIAKGRVVAQLKATF